MKLVFRRFFEESKYKWLRNNLSLFEIKFLCFMIECSTFELSFDLDCVDRPTLSFTVGFFWLFRLRIELEFKYGVWFKESTRKELSYNNGFCFYKDAFSIELFRVTDWSGKGSKGFHFYSHYNEFFLGESDYLGEVSRVEVLTFTEFLKDKDGVVHEVTYSCEELIREFKRKRWFKKRIRAFEFSSDHIVYYRRKDGKDRAFGGKHWWYVGSPKYSPETYLRTELKEDVLHIQEIQKVEEK